MARLCYFNIFFVPVYFLLYFQNTTDYLLAGGFIAFIAFNVLLIKQETQQAITNTLLLAIGALITLALFARELWGVYKLVKILDLNYLTFRMGSYVVLTTLFCMSAAFLLIYYLKKLKVKY